MRPAHWPAAALFHALSTAAAPAAPLTLQLQLGAAVSSRQPEVCLTEPE